MPLKHLRIRPVVLCTLLAPVVLVATYACGEDAATPFAADAGGDVVDVMDVILPADDDAEIARCAPVPPPDTLPPWIGPDGGPPIPEKKEACSSAEVEVILGCRYIEPCSLTLDACEDCLFPPALPDGGPAPPGPLIVQDGGLTRLNVPACVAMLDQGLGCGPVIAAREACVYAACAHCAADGGVVPYETCVTRARATVCLPYVARAEVCAPRNQPDAAAAGCESPGDFKTQAVRYGMLFCGKPDASVDGASGD